MILIFDKNSTVGGISKRNSRNVYQESFHALNAIEMLKNLSCA